MKLVINIPDYVKEQADDGKGEELGIPLWLAYEIANGTPLPKGHGDLIDRNDLLKHCGSTTYYNGFEARKIHFVQIGYVNDAPTIIETDGAESEEA